MLKNNIYLPKENLAQVEEIREIENKELITSEQQAKVIDYFKERQGLINNKSKLSPAARSKIIKRHGADYLSERVFDHDIALMKMYGPGFWEGVWNVTKKVGGFALAVSYATPIAPVTASASLAAAGTAYLMKEYGNESERKVANEIGDILGTAVDAQGIGEETAKTYNNYRSVTRR